MMQANSATRSDGVFEVRLDQEPVRVADPPKPIEAEKGFGDWVPVIEARRVIENGKTVRMQLAVRGEEHLGIRDACAGRTLVFELQVHEWDVLAFGHD